MLGSDACDSRPAAIVDSKEHAHRVGSEWRTTSHREAYVARKSIMVKDDLRIEKPASYLEALELDDKPR